MHRRSFHFTAVTPFVIILQSKNHRHAIVDLLRHRVGVRGDDGEALEPASVRALPGVPQPGEAEGLRLAQVEAEGGPLGLLPFVVVRDGDDAAVAVKRATPEGALLQALGSSVEGAALLIYTGVIGDEDTTNALQFPIERVKVFLPSAETV